METTKVVHEVADESLLRRRQRLLEYMNRDRRKLEKYYIAGDAYHIGRKLELLAKRIDELADIGVEFKLNDMFELIKTHDKKLAERIRASSDWRVRADVLRVAGAKWRDKSARPAQTAPSR